MAYDRYVPEFTDKDGQIYGVMDAETREEVSNLKSALTTKADKIGSSPDLIAGTAEQLMSSDVVEDAVPYLFRRSGGGLNIGNRETLGKIVGGTVAWNSLASFDTGRIPTARDGITFASDDAKSCTANGTATKSSAVSGWFNMIQLYSLSDDRYGHVMLLTSSVIKGTSSKNVILQFGTWTGKSQEVLLGDNVVFKVNSPAGATRTIPILFQNETVLTNYTFTFGLFDLTQMFGSTIADTIYAIEQTTAGAGVAWFRKLFPADYYPYNAGELISVSGLSEHKTVGFNLWDEEWELGYVNSAGNNAASSNCIRSKNYIPVFPNSAYYHKVSASQTVYYYDASKQLISATTAVAGGAIKTTPQNACYMRFYMPDAYGTTYKNDICINLSSPSRNGEYEPYEKHSYPLDSTLTLRGVPKLDSENKLYYDGDEYAPDGTVTRKYGIVDLGTLNWLYDGSFSAVIPLIAKNVYTSPNLKCSKYPTMPLPFSQFTYGIRYIGNASSVSILDPAYTDAAAFKAAMSGVYLVYELATPTTEAAEPYAKIQNVDPYGTEEFVSDTIVPVGHSTKYPADLVKKLEGLPWNFATLIAPTESTTTATQPYAVGSYLILNNTLYKVTSAIANGGTITPGTNVTATTIMAELAALA